MPITAPPSTCRFNCSGIDDDAGIDGDGVLLDGDRTGAGSDGDLADAGPVGSGAEHDRNAAATDRS